MARGMTDKKAVKLALSIAIDSEENMMTGTHPNDDGHQIARANIKAFRRVLMRYYGSPKSMREAWMDEICKGATLINAHSFREMMKKDDV